MPFPYEEIKQFAHSILQTLSAHPPEGRNLFGKDTAGKGSVRGIT